MDARRDRIAGATTARRGRGRARGAALAAGIGALAILAAPAGAAAAAAPPAESGVEVMAHMAASSDRPTAGATVAVNVTLTNTGTSSERVLIDEVIGDVLDDARIQVAPVSSSSAVAVIRLGHDRLALSGRLDPGQVVTVDYTVVIRPVAERGDGVLSRVALAADATSSCADVEVQDTSSGLGDCAAIVIGGGRVEPVGAASAEDPATSSAGGSFAASARSSNASDAGGVSAAGVDGTPVDAVVGPLPDALVVPLSAVLAALLAVSALVVVVRRARRRRSRPGFVAGPAALPTRAASVPSRPARHAQPALTTPVATPRATSAATSVAPVPVRAIRPIPPVVHFESRRERRVAERRLAERGLALPVA